MAMINRFDIVGAFRDLATDNGWRFIYGIDEYASVDFDAYAPGELVLVCEATINPNLSRMGGALEGINFTGNVMLGRKFESDGELVPSITTMASLDETMIQKHDRRLADLWQLLTDALSEMSCTKQFEVTLAGGIPLINFLSQNIDYVRYNFSITD